MNRELIRIPTRDDYEPDASGKWLPTFKEYVCAVVHEDVAQAVAADCTFNEGFKLGNPTNDNIWAEAWLIDTLNQIEYALAWSEHHASA